MALRIFMIRINATRPPDPGDNQHTVSPVKCPKQRKGETPKSLARQIAALLAVELAGPVPLGEPPPAETRAACDRFIAPRNFAPEPMAKIEDIAIDGTVGLRLYTPRRTAHGDPRLVFLFFRDGGGSEEPPSRCSM